MTLVEMVVAMAIVAILATALSLTMVPVLTAYNNNKSANALIEVASILLEDVAFQLRGATGVYLTSNQKSFPDKTLVTQNGKKVPSAQYQKVMDYKARYGLAMTDYSASSGGSVSGYLFPHIKVVDFSNVNSPKLLNIESTDLPDEFREEMRSDLYQTNEIGCPSATSFFVIVRENPDSTIKEGSTTRNLGNVLEIHLTVKKGNYEQEFTKTIVCDNLVIDQKDIYTANLTSSPLTKATVSSGTNQDKWTKYYSIWYSKERI